jgi:putative ABC transport system permease protein
MDSFRNFENFVPPGVEIDLTDPSLFVFLFCCLISVTLLAGLYPAFILSSYQPAHAIRNLPNHTGIERTAYIRKALTVFQFTFSQVLIILAIAIGVQLDYLLNKDLGFSHDAIIHFLIPLGESRDKTIFLRDELSRLSEIEAISLSTPPTSVGLSASIMFDNGKEMKIHDVLHLGADTAFLSVYEIELVAGRNFSSGDNGREYLINETYLHTLGFDDPHEVLGKALDRKYTIVGVVKDFHKRSLHSEIEPLVIYNAPSNWINIKPTNVNNSIRNLQMLLQRVEAPWKAAFPDKKIEFKFLDDTIKRFYEVELRTNTLMRLGACVVILISCLGLFSLSTFTVIQRKKEICIRKISGGSVNSIVVLLSAGLLTHVIIAFIIAVPIAYYFVHEWLLNFAYRIELRGWVFIIAGLVTLFTAFFTVSFQTIKAARTNPVKFLRHE